MKKEKKETLNVRVLSIAFMTLALAIFKPFGLETWQWHAYIHLFAIFMLGIVSCMVTEIILQYVVGMPRSTNRGVDYIIRRNLRFQLINTPLVSLAICLYRHFAMSNMVESNLLSWGNYFETLVIIAFMSFTIGLYWRFKYRSRFLAAELEETRMLNEQLNKLQRQSDALSVPQNAEISNVPPTHPTSDSALTNDALNKLTLTGTTNETLTLDIADLLYIEAVGNYVKVCHLKEGKARTDMLRATSKQMEDELRRYPMIVRCHRAFLVNLQQVEQIISRSGSMQLVIKHSHDSLPVSRSNMAGVKEAIKGF